MLHNLCTKCARVFSVRCFSIDVKPITFENKYDVNDSIKEAEKVVGYSTSFLNLRWLLNDEIANTALYLGKLSGTEHPLLKIAKNLLFKSNFPSWGLIVLLMSKTGGLKHEFPDIERDVTAGILHSQRALADVTEMVRTSLLIHRRILIIPNESENADVLNNGNKIALLSGDYLLSKSFIDLANMRNQKVSYIISSALRDLSEVEFLQPVDEQNRSLAAKPRKLPPSGILDSDSVDFGPYNIDEILGRSKDEWVLRNLLSGANLLGKSCKAAILLSGFDKVLQHKAYLFGKNLALAMQASLDYDNFTSGQYQLDLIGAPIMMQLMKHPEFYEEIEKGLHNVDNCDFAKIRKIVESGTALSDTKDLQNEYSARALENLDHFNDSTAKDALRKLVNVF